MDEELAALADGTLAPDRRAAVLRRVDADPEFADALADQRAPLAAIRGTANEPASDALRAKVQTMAATAGGERCAVARRRPARSLTDDSHPTRAATRRSAACSSARRCTSARASAFDRAVATSSPKLIRRDSVSGGSGCSPTSPRSENWIEDRLTDKARWEASPPACCDELELTLAHRTPEGRVLAHPDGLRELA
jgi:anti-sigma factor RsiW